MANSKNDRQKERANLTAAGRDLSGGLTAANFLLK